MTKLIKAHKIKLNPTPEQADYFWQASKVARDAWNWALGRYNEISDQGGKPRLIAKGDCLKSEFTQVKGDLFPLTANVTSYAHQGAFSDLSTAIKNYHDKRKKGTLPKSDKPRKDGKPHGWPRFKSYRKATPAFYLANTAMRFNGNLVKIQKLDSWIDMYEPLRFNDKINDKIMSGRISYYAKCWWLSVAVEIDHDIPVHDGNAVGVDLGIKSLAVTSEGQVFENPKAFYKSQKKLARLQRQLSRKQEGSANWHKQNIKIAKLHYRIACVRNETIHEMTTELTKNHSFIGLEDLNVKGMVKNRKLAKSVSDSAMGTIKQQMQYKTTWTGGRVQFVDRFFPSSKTCSNCGWHNADLTLSDRTWKCKGCGEIIDRDYNAAINIRNEALRLAEL